MVVYHIILSVRYCFMSSIQEELNIFRMTWNQHIIRRQRNQLVPSGAPSSLMLQAPQDVKTPVPEDILNHLRQVWWAGQV